MKAVVNNSIGNAKLKFNGTHDIILVEEFHRRDSEEVSMLSSMLNVENRGRDFYENSNKSNGGKWMNDKSKSRSGNNMEFRNCDNIDHMKRRIASTKEK